MSARGNALRRNFPGMIRGCSKCGHLITVTEQMCKRRTYVCGSCHSLASSAWAEQNRPKKRANNNAYQRRHSADRADQTRRYRDRYPERKSAQQAVQTALRNGRLIRGPCETCGSAEVHAHHNDYSKPLDVVWLCHQHHMQSHQAAMEARKR